MKPLMHARDVALLLGLARRTPYDKRWRERVGLPAVKIGQRLRFRPEDVEQLRQEGGGR